MPRSELDVIRWLRNHLTSQHGAMHTTLHDRQLVVQNLAHAAVLVDFRVEDEEFVRGEATAARCNSAHVRLFLFQIRKQSFCSRLCIFRFLFFLISVSVRWSHWRHFTSIAFLPT